MKKEIGIGLGAMALAASTFLWTEHTSVTVILLIILVSSLTVLTVYYMRRARWRQYPSGRVFLYLLLAFDSLVLYWLLSRLVEPRDIRISIFNVLITGLIAAVWGITATFWKAQRHAKAERLRRETTMKEENQP